MANKINVILRFDISAFDKALAKVQRSTQRFAATMQDVGGTLSQNLTLPLVAAGGAAIKAFADMEKLNKGMVAIMGSTEAAADELTRLREVARLPGLGLKEAVQGSINLQAVGLSADEARSTLLGFGKALAATGKGKVELESIQYQLTQMISKNKLLAEDYKVIQSNLPLMAKGMEAAFGTNNIEAVRATGIGAKEFALRLSNALANLKETQNVTGGLSNAFENFTDSLFIAGAQMGAAINKSLGLEDILGKMATAVQRLADWFDSLSPGMQKVIVITAATVAAIGPLLFAIGSLGKIAGVAILGLGKLVGIVRSVAAAFTLANAAMLAPVVAIGLLLAGVASAYREFEGFRRVVNGIGYALKEFAQIAKEAGQAVAAGFAELKEGNFKAAAKKFGEAIVKTNPVGIALTQGKRLQDAFREGWEDNTDYVAQTLNKFRDSITKATAEISSTVSTIQPGATPAGGGSGLDNKELQSFESRAQAVFLKLRQSATELQTKTANALVSPLLNIETLESPIKKTEEFFRGWQQAVLNAGTQAEIFGGDQLSVVQSQLQTTGNFLSQAVDQFGANSFAVEQLTIRYENFKKKAEELAAVQEYATKVQNAFTTAWETGAQAASKAGATLKSVLKAIGRAALQAAADVVKAEIIKGVVAVMSDALQKFGLFGIAIAGAAGAAAGALFQTAINKIAPPALAQGGLTTGPTLALIGDNPSGREAVIPFEKMGQFLDMVGSGQTTDVRLTGMFEVRGPDLLLSIDRANQEKTRIR